MAASGHERRYISNSHFGDNTNIYQGDVHLHIPHKQARAEVKAVCAIPYPRNEDLVSRPDLINKLDELLPQTPGFYSAALWGLGGSGKTQLALHYAYQRCNGSEYCVFWVHADSEATFTTDYKTIGKKLGVSETLDGSDLLDAVRSSIEAQPQWVIILDNADDLKLFGVVDSNRTNESLYKYIPQGSHGTVLWTSRDKKIEGTLVGSTRGIMVPPMTRDEATSLLVAASGDASAVADTEIDRLLEELQRLPLAVSQAGAYLRRTSMTIKEYLELLMQGSSRWDLLKTNDFDRHRRPEVSNSVLETWKISTRRIREESELSYRLLHIIAYVDNQDIPYELIMAASQYDVGDKGKAKQISDTEVKQAITRLVEFSFLDMRREEGGLQSYEMHKLVQEAVRYGLCTQGRMEMAQGMITTTGQDNTETGEAYYASMTLQIVDDMFPITEKTSWATCDKYMAHAIRVGEWAEVSGKKVETVKLLDKVSGFLYDRGRWREKEPLDLRVLDLRRETLGEMHPGTIWSLASLAGTYFEQGRYDEAERICTKALNLRQEVLGEKHQHAIWSMQLLAVIYTEQGRYTEAEGICKQALNIQCEVLGENHADTMWTMSYLSVVHIWQGQYSKAEGICKQILHFRRKEFGDNHPDTIKSIRDLVETYYGQGHYDKAEELQKQVLDLQREVMGDKHPYTTRSMKDLGTTYFCQGRYHDAERIYEQALVIQREVFGENHPFVLQTMGCLARALSVLGQYDKAEELQRSALELQRELLGEKHPDTITSIRRLELIKGDRGRKIKWKPGRGNLRGFLHSRFRKSKE
ncbi:hypothetical protein TRIATDRAFT_226514 [Trichoderma atroviride IMI 206040]|uniref:Uncharacterized protein n=1 Tax=Hypocrea atroviridis (strain ATCC 20476 / IMI 206040) TaxID=452589 RepID=G9P6J2_HYPAI|nr:uncharacterized protein TRIATDRAFT_226514 [Trichoderma atroviride IMI 206040]EHK40635.1 hypothetical protein TRIATDRAFT_226514 [Trichoderma atroviride IMI 206040]